MPPPAYVANVTLWWATITGGMVVLLLDPATSVARKDKDKDEDDEGGESAGISPSRQNPFDVRHGIDALAGPIANARSNRPIVISQAPEPLTDVEMDCRSGFNQSIDSSDRLHV
ncbi:hypothetical protein SUNI508_09966 [Seiridium unicorne]|uniref:Uncharacterized protein n=1 Tax=Seiridium unicorne TaxID=138068 RepID=A0ABR2UNX9_9PEZI